MSKDGTRRVTLRVEVRADVIALAAALTLHLDRLSQDAPRSMRTIRQRAAKALAVHGGDVALHLGDMLADDFDGDLARLYERVVHAVARAFGFNDAEAAEALAAMPDPPEQPDGEP